MIKGYLRIALCIGALAGCSARIDGSSAVPTINVPQTGGYSVLLSFRGKDGAGPYASLIAVGNDLYGTTVAGGSGCRSNPYFTPRCGVVFKLTPTTSGYSESIVHYFRGGPGDGAHPLGSLLAMSGSIYGTTSNGGEGCGGTGCGTVFQITPSGRERILHVFKGGKGDGSLPEAGLAAVEDVLYGATTFGCSGACSAQTTGCGTIFAITQSEDERLVHAFQGGLDGAEPTATLASDASGALYGTTTAGGSGACQHQGCGTAFTFTKTGALYRETILHAFKGGTDGADPIGGLVESNGSLFGTTIYGGKQCSPPGCGTIFEIDRFGKERIAHAFAGGSDGYYPYGTLINFDGALYGTSSNQGGNSQCAHVGCGTIFKLARSSSGYTKTIVHSFKGGSKPYNPVAGLTVQNNILFGAAFEGPTCAFNGLGCGAIFSLNQ